MQAEADAHESAVPTAASVSRQPSWLPRQCTCGDDDDDDELGDSNDSNDSKGEADESDDEDGDVFLALCRPASEDATEDEPADAASTAVFVPVSPPTSDVPASPSTGLGANPYAPVCIVELAQPAASSPSRASSRPSSRRDGSLVASAASSERQPTGAVPLSKQRAPAPASMGIDGYSTPTEPYVCSLSAPVLFTAPHGLKLKRGIGPRQSARNHARERYTTELVLKLAACFGKRRAGVSSPQSNASPSVASLMVWNYKTAPIDDPTHADPNFLDRRSLCHSPWHSCLHAWKSLHGFGSSEACPRLFHVDIHGKNDRKADMDIDVGLQALEEEGCLTEEAVQTLRTVLVTELRRAFKGRIAVSSKVKKPFPITIEADPILNGYWGRGTVMTISHQAALLGITAVQLEIPLAIRRLLMKDEALFDAFASAIYKPFDKLVAKAALPLREGWATSAELGRYLEGLGSAEEPLCALTLTQLDTNVIDSMLSDLRLADTSNVHGKTI